MKELKDYERPKLSSICFSEEVVRTSEGTDETEGMYMKDPYDDTWVPA